MNALIRVEWLPWLLWLLVTILWYTWFGSRESWAG
jgi:hypothetical protein